MSVENEEDHQSMTSDDEGSKAASLTDELSDDKHNKDREDTTCDVGGGLLR